jgi:hypothetical protein
MSPTSSLAPSAPTAAHGPGSLPLAASSEGLGAYRQQSLSGAPSLSALGAKRNSLPPLRGMPSMSGAGVGAELLLASPTAAAAGGMPATGLSCTSLTSLGPASRTGSHGGGLSTLAHSAETTPAHVPATVQPGVLSPTEGGMRLSRQCSGGMRQSFGRGHGVAAPGVAPFSPQLESVCRAQVELYR